MIQSLEYRLFDRQTGRLVGPKDDPSDAYGLHNDVYVEVKLKGTLPQTDTLKVILTATTPRTYDEARGEVPATTQRSVKNDVVLSEIGDTTTLPFLLEFVCNPMTFKVEIPALKISKTAKAEFACAD